MPDQTYPVVYKGEKHLLNEADLLVIRLQSQHFTKLVNYPNISTSFKHVLADMAQTLTELAVQASEQKGGSYDAAN